MPTSLTRNVNASVRKLLATNRCLPPRPAFISVRFLSDYQNETSSVHFRATSTPHPLASKENTMKASQPTPTISGLDKDGKPIVEVIAIENQNSSKTLAKNLIFQLI